MKIIPDWLKNGYLKLIDPLAGWLIRRHVHPNTITVFGTLLTVVGGVIYATGHIRTGGWFLGITAFTDVLDGTVARRTNRTSRFGAFLDSTLDRLADGAVLGGLMIFYAISPVHHSVWMMAVALAGLVGAFLTSYTRARAEALGIDAKVGTLQRPERVVLLSAPQAFFGLALHGWVLAAIVILLAVTAWITVVQRVACVYRETAGRPEVEPIRLEPGQSEALAEPRAPWLRRRRAARGLP